MTVSETDRRPVLRVTMSDIADEAGVSRATVSRALQGAGRISADTRRRIADIAARRGYVPNVMATQLAAGSTGTIGLLLRDAANPAYGLLFTQLQESAHRLGVALVSMTITVDEHGQRQISGLQRLLGMRVAGLIVATGGVTSEQLLPFCAEVPIMRAGRPETTDAIHAISYDEQVNATLLADHVAGLGHRSVAVMVTEADNSYPEYVRATTMVARLRERGASVHPVPVTTLHTGVEQVVDLAARREVTAIMCPSDYRQLEVLRAARALGIDVPGQVSVTGCDGILPGVDLLGLTTVRLPVEELAARTVHHMVELISGESSGQVIQERIAGTLLPGGTAGPVPP